MKTQSYKNLLLILILLLFLASLWVLNQRKSYNPVFSLKTSLGFKSKNNLDYSSLSSVFYILSSVRELDKNFQLNPILKEVIADFQGENKQFTVIGRIIKNRETSIEVYEYATPEKANLEFKRLTPEYKDRMILFKNLIIKTNNQESYQFLAKNLK